MLRLQGTLPFVRQEWRFLLFGMLLAFWSGPGQTYVISVIGGDIRSDFNLSNGEFGTIYTVATLVCAAILWKAGPLVDRLPLKSFVVKVSLLMVAATMAFGFVQWPITLFFGIIAIRFMGQGMMTHIALTSMARRYEAERGRAVAVAGLGFPLGQALFPPLIVLALGFVDWRLVWPAMGILAAFTLLPVEPFLIRHTSHQDGAGATVLQAADEDAKHWTRAEMLRDKKFYFLVPTAMAPAAIVTGLFFHQVYLVEMKGWSFEFWSFSFIVFAFASLFGGVISGFLVDMYRARRLVPYVLLPMSLGILLFAYAHTQTYALLVMFFLGIGSGGTNPVLSSLWPEIYGTRHLGAIRSVATVVMVFGSALGPVFMGWALDASISLEAIIIASVIITFISAFLAKLAFFIK
ncbi:MFS transporter [Sneathiella sp. HT1-7]|uniref:MFS transporter n=1 Tax=Sneathiella sp. HT1-7 TaxID=2887192 RepID=UPI001D159D1E|nr:MFS transporter [Sneathiella sp. HT1-7]MCC3304440.1 MFS transporter [Sneathiella sp. HT1-7]